MSAVLTADAAPETFAEPWERFNPAAAEDDADRATRLRAAAVWLAEPINVGGFWRGHYHEKLSRALGDYAVDAGLCVDCLLEHGAEIKVDFDYQLIDGRNQLMSACLQCGAEAYG